MQQVGEAVDHRAAPVLREVEHILMGEHAGHDAVGESGEHARGVGHRLTHAQVDLVVVQHDGKTPELEHPHLERHTSPRGRLLEDHGQGLA